MASFFPPIHLHSWIEKHREFLKPPVCNKLVFEENGFYIMVVGGPNQRSDYHYEEGAEFFYQIHGDMCLHTIIDGKKESITIREGEIFLLPPKVPHCPQRQAGTVGLVIERRRTTEEKDGLLWFCEECNHLLYEEYFPLRNIEKDFPPVFERFFSNAENLRCSKCHWQMEAI